MASLAARPYDTSDSIERPPPSLLVPSAATKPLRSVAPASLVVGWTEANPWTDEYLERELASMSFLPGALAVEYKYGDDNGRHVVLGRRKNVVTECYLRTDFIDWGPYAHLKIDGDVWMSVTPMEIESQYMPIMLAEGRVGVGGLGLGYAALRMASKPEVAEVVVYEINPLILHLWDRAVVPNAPARWLAKIKLVECDVTTLRDEQFDFFYNDVYQRMLAEAAIAHWPLLCRENSLGGYHFWGMEAWLLPFVLTGQKHRVPFYLRNTYFPFFKALFQAFEAGHGFIGDAKVSSYPHNLRDIKQYLKGTEVWPE